MKTLKTFQPVVKKGPAPQRVTQPRSFWRDLLCGMKAGDWFEVPKEKYNSVATACVAHVRGKYSVYRHPTKEGFYICTIIK